jgi:hypothetical protein
VGDGLWRSAGAGYESEGRRFESCRARYIKSPFAGTLAEAKVPNV